MDAQTLIKGSLRLFGGIRRGFTPRAEDLNEGLEALNLMIGSWAARKLMIPYRTEENFTPSSSATTFTIGSGGDFNTARPISIDYIYLKDSSGSDYPLTQMDSDKYASISDKDTTQRPTRYWYRPEYPLGKIIFDSTLSTSYTAYILSYKPLTQIASLTTDLSLPDEYIEALKYSLAVRLAPEYGKQVTQEVWAIAQSTYSVIENINASNRVPELSSDLYARDYGYNIYSDS